VFQGSWQTTPVALKVLYDTTVAKNTALFEREVDTMARLHHPNIVQFLGFATFLPDGSNDAQLGIVMELFKHGALEDYVSRASPTAARWIAPRLKRRFCSEMAMALAYLHNRRPSFLVHRDIKPSNFMLTNSLRVKLCDFGLSRVFDRNRNTAQSECADGASSDVAPCGDDTDVLMPLPPTAVAPPPAGPMRRALSRSFSGSDGGSSSGDGFDMTANCGTVRFMAPEVAVAEDGQVAKYTTSCDVFSLGLVYYFIFERELPHIPGCTSPAAHLAALRENRRPPYTSATPPSARKLIGECWSTEPASRPHAEKLIERWRALERAAPGSAFACLLGGSAAGRSGGGGPPAMAISM
jgi:serine/threonine protein kinase